MTQLDTPNLPEDAPLLQNTAQLTIANDSSRENSRGKFSVRSIIILLLLYLMFLDLGYELIVPAQTRVIEQIFCKLHYNDLNLDIQDGREIDENRCKIAAVQAKVAMLKGWQITFDSIGMLVFSAPWAYVADIYGRKPVLLLLTGGLFAKYVYVQYICYLGGAIPLKMVWFSAIHTAIGGSVTVATALIYTVIADVVQEHHRVSVFFQVMATTIITQFLGSLSSAALMVWNPWIPMSLGLIVELISLATLLFIPETICYKSPICLENGAASNSTAAQPRAQLWRIALQRIHNSFAFLISDRRILLLLPTFFVHMILLNRDILLQYISARYNVSLAESTAIISIRSGLVVILCVFILPTINFYSRRRFGANRSDLILSGVSGAVIALTFLGVGLATNLALLITTLVLNSFGWGLYSFLRSLLTTLVDAHNLARLNSLIGIIDTIGFMVGSPALASLFVEGMSLGGMWSGLPFLVCAGTIATLALVISQVRL